LNIFDFRLADHRFVDCFAKVMIKIEIYSTIKIILDNSSFTSETCCEPEDWRGNGRVVTFLFDFERRLLRKRFVLLNGFDIRKMERGI